MPNFLPQLKQRRRARYVGRLLVAVLLGQPSVSMGQATIAIPYKASCAACSIHLDTILVLGGANYGNMISFSAWVARDSKGTVYVEGYGPRILVFDPNGKLVTTFGGPGQGPGDFSRNISRLLIGPGDSLYVFDSRPRAQLFNPQHAFVRSVRLPSVSGSISLDHAGNIVIAAAPSARTQFGIPFQILDSQGRMVTAYDGGSASLPAVGGLQGSTSLTMAASARELWNWNMNALTFEKWSLTGRRLVDLRIADYPDFRVAEPFLLRDVDPAELMRISRDPSTASDSMRALISRSQGTVVRLLHVDKAERMWIWILSEGRASVHVVDVNRRQHLASQSLTQLPLFIGGSEVNGEDIAFWREVTADGTVRLILVRFRLSGVSS